MLVDQRLLKYNIKLLMSMYQLQRPEYHYFPIYASSTGCPTVVHMHDNILIWNQ